MRPDETIKGVIAKLQYLKSSPVEVLETGIDEVQLKLIDLRNYAVKLTRGDPYDDKTKAYLQHLNVALSVLFGLEYPVTGFQRNKIDQAIPVLQPMAEMHLY